MPSDTLELMLHRQHGLQSKITGRDILTLDGKERSDYIREMMFALEDELHEAAAEVSWKSWAKGSFFNREAYLKELVDALHFWMNLVLAAGSPDLEGITDLMHEVAKLYFHKANINENRAEDGYDGRSSKCYCGRDIEDGSPGPINPIIKGTVMRVFECVCGSFNLVKIREDATAT